jgi:hypothetical protein
MSLRDRERPAEVWIRDLEAEPSEWHLIVRSGEPIGCGRVSSWRHSSIWPVKEGETGPELNDRCAECCDAIVRTLGRLPLA